MRPSWPLSKLKLSPILASPYEHASVATPGCILLFIATVQVSHPCLPLSGWLLTNVQVNIITTLHDMRHTCNLHHTSTSIHFLLSIHLPFSWAGWLSSTRSVRYTCTMAKNYICFSVHINLSALFDKKNITEHFKHIVWFFP